MLPRPGASAERPTSRNRGVAKKPTSWKAVWPDIRELLRPRRGQLLLGLALIAVSRVSGLVLPASTKFFVDDILGKHHTERLFPLIAAILAATALQGITGFWLTQLLSKSAQRLIAELRCKMEQHVARLSVTFFDSNKSGQLVSRIMNDVEGVRNLVGTGLVEFIGGLLTSVLAFFFLLRLSPLMTVLTAAIVVVYSVVLQRAFQTLRPIFRERGKITAEVTGRLTETLGGIRVVKGYHAEAREDAVFQKGADRILANVLQSLTGVSVLSLSATVLLGVVGALIMYVGGRQILNGSLTTGGYVSFMMFLGFLVAPVFQMVGIGTQLTEAVAGLERTREILNEAREDQDPHRIVALGPIHGHVEFERVSFEYETGKPVLHDVTFDAEPGTVTALVGSSGSGKSTTIGLLSSFHKPREGRVRRHHWGKRRLRPAGRHAERD
jgi:ABC-type multidrug transport system fused ATPase/permease subunit